MIEYGQFFVNLKRFDIPRSMGGICPSDDVVGWMVEQLSVISKNFAHRKRVPNVVFLLPESLLATAIATFPTLQFGCQSVIAEDVAVQKNFGAFTGMRTAKSMRALGCTWAMIGHSEERKAMHDFIEEYSNIASFPQKLEAERQVIARRLNREMVCATEAGLKVLLCLGESLDQRGEGVATAELFSRVQKVLDSQLSMVLEGISSNDVMTSLLVAYEPIWAIGPGKIPPDASYIEIIAKMIHQWFLQHHGVNVSVLYGGGLKKENCASISSLDTIQGGLVALTRFSDTKESLWYRE
jgi:triosephosphate isomerase